ncbi:MAG: DUF4404 family protein [Planctomycetota bacterium]
MRKELDEALVQLRASLDGIESIDSEEADRLREAATTIAETLDEADVNSASLAKRMQDQCESFQESHPTLVSTAGRIADMLSQMGI